jgi:Asp-tRNA(Asn)/Glu-tRNA(Gln) amidotransferase A subunit family amidase
MKYMPVCNFAGNPGITVPVGHDAEGMPIGLQLIGRPYEEALLLHSASVVEVLCREQCRRLPAVSYDVLFDKPVQIPL